VRKMHLFILLCVSTTFGLEVINKSSSSVVLDGEDATLWCEGDEEFDTCTWFTPDEETKCGPLTPTQSMCRQVSNVHFNGSSTNCKILVKALKNSQSGEWTCSLEKAGVAVNSSVLVTKAIKGSMHWGNDIYGTIILTEGDPRTFTCEAFHSRPLGAFIWHLGEDDAAENEVVNENEVVKSIGSDGVANASQIFILDPKPDLNDQKLFCTFVQVDQAGEELYRERTSLEFRVHYLSAAKDTSILSPANSGEDYNISVKFEALPKPHPEDIVWTIDKNGETVEIAVEDENYVQKNQYVVYPLQQNSEYEYTAVMTIMNISQQENEYQHKLHISNTMGTGKTLDIAREFEIQVDRVQIAENGGSSLTIIIVIVVILIIIAIILIAMTTVYAKNNSKLCYQNSQRPYIKPDINEQKVPLQVQHHPYARPSEK